MWFFIDGQRLAFIYVFPSRRSKWEPADYSAIKCDADHFWISLKSLDLIGPCLGGRVCILWLEPVEDLLVVKN